MSRRVRPLLAIALSAACGLPLVAAEPALPLEKVVLFTSGVGFFQHGGRVTDDAEVEMTFKAAQINDLLKSMVLEDLGGGTVSTVSYASRDPLTKTLETFAVNLTDNPSLGQLIGRLRGARIEVDAAAPASGTIVGVETRMVPAGDDGKVEKEYLTVLTADGLRTLPLDTVTRLRLLDERLQGELEKALAVLALGHDNERKSVTLSFAGKGPRQVRVGYVQEAPVWKTSYRIVLPAEQADGGKAKALLQGWAIVENTTDQDWREVRMSLVSGRPISFTMDLYQPLYVPRPEVQQELYASLAPQVYRQDLQADEKAFGKEAAKGEQLEALAKRSEDRRNRALAAAMPAAPAAMAARKAMEEADAAVMLTGAAAVRSMAEGVALGELFRYEISTPVSIARQRSAMLPIVGEDVEAERVAIYNDRVLAKHPLAGLRLKNVTSLNLMQGPITVYDAGGYAGDARIEDMPPGSERLVSYAVDLDVEVAPRLEQKPEELVSVKIAKGTLVAARKLVRRKVFEIKNSGKTAATLLVEHPREGGWRLVEPKQATETTAQAYRFAVTAEPGKPTRLEVAEEQLLDQRFAVTSLDDGAIAFYTNSKVTSPRVKESLQNVIEMKRNLERIAAERTQREQQVATVGQEQDRIRQNMQQLDRGSELYTRYVQKFAQQEDTVEMLRKEIADRLAREQEARRMLEQTLLALDAE
jgi:hypothetical protein